MENRHWDTMQEGWIPAEQYIAGVFLWLTHPIVEECYFIDLAIANMLYETILDF